MLETQVVGNKDWVERFLTADDFQLLESFDFEMRIRFIQETTECHKVKTYEQLVEEDGENTPTHCEHGVPLYRRCGVCRALFG